MTQQDTHVGGPLDGQPIGGDCTYSQGPVVSRDAEGRSLRVTYARIDGKFVFRGHLPWNEGQPPEPPPEPVTPLDSSALKQRSAHYPAHWNDRVPKRVRLLCRVFPDCAWVWSTVEELQKLDRQAGEEHDVYVNSHGAVSVILPGFDQLGVRPDEFEVIEWHEEKAAPSAASVEQAGTTPTTGGAA